MNINIDNLFNGKQYGKIIYERKDTNMKNKLLLLCCVIISLFIFTTGCGLSNKEKNNNTNKIDNESVIVPGIQKVDYKSDILYHKFDSEIEKLDNGLDTLIDDSFEKTLTPGGLIDKYYYSYEPTFYTLEMKLDYEKLDTINKWYRNKLETEGWALTDNSGYSFKGEKDDFSLEVSIEIKDETTKNKYIYLSITVGETLE